VSEELIWRRKREREREREKRGGDDYDEIPVIRPD